MMFDHGTYQVGICDEPYCRDYYDTREDADATLGMCGRCARRNQWKLAGLAYPDDAKYSRDAYIRFLQTRGT